MAKCLRCGAGNEWIQGKVRVEAIDDERLALYRDLHRAAKEYAAIPSSWDTTKERDACIVLNAALAALDAAGVNAEEVDGECGPQQELAD